MISCEILYVKVEKITGPFCALVQVSFFSHLLPKSFTKL